MSRHWPRVRLGDVLIERQEIPDADNLALGNMRIISKISFNEGKIELRSDTSTKTGMILIRPGDLVVSGINAAKGAIAIYGKENQEPVAATIHYGAYEAKADRVDITYLWWYFRSGAFRNILLESLPGGIKTELKANRFLPIEIPLPPLAEQRRIVARIEELATEIHEARALRQQAADESELILYAALRRQRHDLISHTSHLAPIGNITTVTSGGTPSRDNPSYWNGDVPWIKTGELIDGDILAAEEHITEVGVANSSAKIFPSQTVLIALYGQGQTRGRTGRLLIPAATNQACCAILPNEEKLDPRFVQYWLRGLYFELREQAQGGAQPNWNGGMIKALKIPLISVTEQHRIVAELDALQAEVDALKRHQADTAAELGALLPAILDRAFRGEL